MASISSGFAAQQRMHQTARQRTASAPLVMRVAFGAPLKLEGEDYPALTKLVEEAVRAI